MKSEELTKALNDVSDQYIVQSRHKPAAPSWKKWAVCAAAAVVLISGYAISSISRMGMGAKSSAPEASDSYQKNASVSDKSGYYDGYAFGGASYDMELAESEGGYSADLGSYKEASTALQSIADTGSANLKLIYRANIQLQTTEFDKTVTQLKTLTTALGGYFERINTDNGGYYSDGSYKYGTYTVRIPTEKYDAFISSINDTSHVVNIDQSVEDIGLEYADTEGRLESLRIKQERLQELLKKSASLAEIIEVENSLTDVEYEIDRYTSKLKKYDSLIGYSTITVYIESVAIIGDTIEQDNSFAARLGRSFTRGLHNFADDAQSFVLWIAENIIGICLFLALALAVFFTIRRIIRKRSR